MAGGDTLLAVGDTRLLALGGDILPAEEDITEGDLGSFSGAQ